MTIVRVPWSEGLVRFLKEHGNGHITRTALEFYSSKQVVDTHFWAVTAVEMGSVIGISCSALVDGEVRYGVTAVREDFRNQGIGSGLLKSKIALIRNAGYEYKTIVAEDNHPSLRMVQKAALQNTGSVRRRRRTGEYNALKFEDRT